jgi:hypothetical protein
MCRKKKTEDRRQNTVDPARTPTAEYWKNGMMGNQKLGVLE